MGAGTAAPAYRTAVPGDKGAASVHLQNLAVRHFIHNTAGVLLPPGAAGYLCILPIHLVLCGCGACAGISFVFHQAGRKHHFAPGDGKRLWLTFFHSSVSFFMGGLDLVKGRAG